MSRIIEQLKIIRQKLSLKQSELGKKLGLPQSHISKIEQGITDPRLSTITDMARILDQELILVPRQLAPHVLSIISDKEQKRKWQPDSEINE